MQLKISVQQGRALVKFKEEPVRERKMEVGNFVNPLGTLQMVSVLSCIRSMSEVLYAEKFLKESDIHEPISTINALYHFLLDKNDLDLNERKLYLAKKVGNSCNLNGARDPDVVSKTLNHVIESTVFDKYGSIDGFIAYSSMSSSDYSLKLPEQLKQTLRRMGFQNEKGETSHLDDVAVEQIFKDLIQPLLPGNRKSPKPMNGKSRTRRSPLIRVLLSRTNYLQEAIKFAMTKNSKLSETVVKNELSKYAFQEPKETELMFVKDWAKTKFQKTPEWAEKLKVDYPDVFQKLKYSDEIGSKDLTTADATKQIDTLYPLKENADIRKILPVDKVLKDFKRLEAFKEMRFPDYYALRWYGDDGFMKMNKPSDQEKRMKNAIYRLAVRQFETPGQQFAQQLFRGERRPTAEIEKILANPKKEFLLDRFSSTSTDINKANEYCQNIEPGQTRVLYKFNFAEPTIRAKANHLLIKDESETILLPGSKFHIDSVEKDVKSCISKCGGDVRCITVTLSSLENESTILEREKSIMKAVKELAQEKTKFYVDP